MRFLTNMCPKGIVAGLLVTGICHGLFAQTETPEPTDRPFTIDTPLTIDFAEEDEESERTAPKKKKEKKNYFYAVKTKKGYTRKGFGENTIIELFHYLKEYQEPDPYIQEIYWYDFQRKQIRSTKNINKDYGVILHGPYRKMRGEQLIEEGIYYFGAKHGRWVTYDRNDILVDKKKFYQGWPRESLVRYYDEERTKLKEVIPVVFGEREGTYYYFFENGEISVRGTYANDRRVGKWIEFYSVKGRRKKEVQYTDDPWDDLTPPHILREWNAKGQLVYDRQVYLRNTAIN